MQKEQTSRSACKRAIVRMNATTYTHMHTTHYNTLRCGRAWESKSSLHLRVRAVYWVPATLCTRRAPKVNWMCRQTRYVCAADLDATCLTSSWAADRPDRQSGHHQLSREWRLRRGGACNSFVCLLIVLASRRVVCLIIIFKLRSTSLWAAACGDCSSTPTSTPCGCVHMCACLVYLWSHYSDLMTNLW